MDTLLKQLMGEAFAAGASDVFLMEGEAPRVRIHGNFAQVDHPPLTRTDLESLWLAGAANPETDQDHDSSISIDGTGRLRANYFRTLSRLAVALRPIRTQIPDFSELLLPGDVLSSWMLRRSGLILFSGPAGAGKSTSVASCLRWANDNQSRHIVTIEDPIEYLFQNNHCFFSQREIRRDTATFAVALRAALRQSPDIIFVGEIRDPETAAIALRAAETGHLVLSTLHSNGVAETLERIDNILEAQNQVVGTSQMLSHQLIGVMSQQLLPTISGNEMPICEYFENSGATRTWIAEKRFADVHDHVARSGDAHCRSFLDSLVAAVHAEEIHADVARSAAARPQDFDRALRGIR